MTSLKTTSPLPASSATLAMLKALHDAGKDHVEMFQPFVLHAIASLPDDDFATADVQPAFEALLGLKVPLATLETLLMRAVHRGQAKRVGGRFFRVSDALQDSDIKPKLAKYAAGQTVLCSAFRQFADEKNVHLTDDEAWHLIIAFVQDSHLGLLLEQDMGSFDNGDIFQARESRLVALFITERCLTTPELSAPLQSVLEGYILQNTLLLRDIKTVAGPFTNLRVFFDTRFLFDVVGLSGAPALTAARESLELIRVAGARLAAFEVTVKEMRRVLALYENRLGTSEGRLSLRQTPLSRHMLTNRFGPADVRQLSALLESKLSDVGISVIEIPPHKAKFTLDEEALSKRLRKPTEDVDGARVTHDVDCVAAILVLRAGRTSNQLEQAREVFATTTGLVVKNVNAWYREQGEAGVPPVIYYSSLSSRAWLKKPAAVTGVKLHELIALCAAVLRPSIQVWNSAVLHLRRMKALGEITSDEQVAIVANEFTDLELSGLEMAAEPDSASIAEVIERVRGKYREDADQRAAAAEAVAAEKVADAQRRQRESDETAAAALRAIDEKLRRTHSKVHGFARRTASLLSWLLFLTLGTTLVAGTWLGLGGVWGALVGGIVVLWTLAGFVWGTSLADLHKRTQSALQQWITARFIE